ncbi:MAG TPA: hypothetical protein VH307_06690 [Streptosporangiaceae bacterium]|jgi:hypothetical protein|nr:hypothetical protein [Streptosporangiaceae bacterium]
MKGTQTALALGVGYVLGRRRKMRLTMMLAAAAASGGLGGVGGGALRRGMTMLGSTDALGKVSPQLAEIVDTVRGDLLDAGKAAAVAAATNRIGSLTDTLHERAQSIRQPAEAMREQAAGRIPKQRRRAGADEYAESTRDRVDAEPEEAEEPEPDEADENGRKAASPRRQAARGGSVVTRTRTSAASRARR